MTFPCYPEYKESGVEWLGLVPAAWRVVRTFHLGVCIRTGKVDVNIQEEDGIYPFFTCSKDAKKARQFSFDCEALLVAGNGEVGYTQYYKGKFEAYQRTYVLSDFGDMNARFLQYHYMENLVVSVKGKSIGSVIQFITLNDLRDFPVPIPSQSEQTQIARFLDHETARIDALIEEQQRLIELLKEKRQAVISHAVTKGLDPTVPMKDSGVEWLGEEPAHWSVSPLKFLVDEKVAGPYGASLTKAMYTDSGYRVYGQQQVISDDFSIGDYYISEEKFSEMQRYVVFPGDVLISVMGTIGRVSVVPVGVEVGIINPRLVRYKFAQRKVAPEFVKILLMSLRYQSRLREESQGSTMEGLNMVILGDLPLVLPSLDEQRRRQKLSATPDLSGTVLPLCLIPNSALKSAPPFKSVVPKASACAGLPA
ncbi:restriction endonuclease subunit S [Stutzerimonas zhaodongensis]|uniref:restriction endonuclease subunit S n=1 Tax=Stutzerimonas zhaodongensis TaxID=1176257 RepID=UPI001F4DEA59|nr:restriction endonuclease subunit S [Stutzerimonas zhaodongensis]UNG20266.1 restriction endonuclease subunit S [Stutzerimonas zhaodongensis]